MFWILRAQWCGQNIHDENDVLPFSCDQWRAFVLNLDVNTRGTEIKSRIGVVPQEDGLDTDFSVLENLQIYASYHNISADVAEKRARELLRFMRIDEKSTSPVDQLSGGMKRRLAIARGMINNPEMLF